MNQRTCELLANIHKQRDSILPRIKEGVDQYLQIIARIDSGGPLAEDQNFRTIYRAFFVVRRDDDWMRGYFGLLDHARKSGLPLNFEGVLRSMFTRLTHNGRQQVEKSFASKLVHVAQRDLPIIDSKVIDLLSHYEILAEPRVANRTPDRQIAAWVEYYNRLEEVFRVSFQCERWKDLEAAFDKRYPKARRISQHKKLDFYLWKFTQ